MKTHALSCNFLSYFNDNWDKTKSETLLYNLHKEMETEKLVLCRKQQLSQNCLFLMLWKPVENIDATANCR